jgi:hypothetical protein
VAEKSIVERYCTHFSAFDLSALSGLFFCFDRATTIRLPVDTLPGFGGIHAGVNMLQVRFKKAAYAYADRVRFDRTYSLAYLSICLLKKVDSGKKHEHNRRIRFR